LVRELKGDEPSTDDVFHIRPPDSDRAQRICRSEPFARTAARRVDDDTKGVPYDLQRVTCAGYWRPFSRADTTLGGGLWLPSTVPGTVGRVGRG